MSRRRLALLVCWTVAIGAAVGACTSKRERVVFHEDMTLGGQSVRPGVLNRGRTGYMLYCYNCHGMDGKGDGPASHGMRPPPRNFHTGIFKFAKVVDGLPHDEDLHHIIKGGLVGTGMLPWRDIPDERIDEIIQYIKTFVPAFSDPEEQLGERIVAGADPWGPAKKSQAIARGKLVYHGFATCQQCHAAYATRQEIFEASSQIGNQAITTFRDHLYEPELKESPIEVGGHKLMVLPPDFLWNDVRSGTEIPDLFRTIGAGVPPVMPSWHGSMPDEDIWAVAYYVRSLIELRGTPAAAALQARLRNQRPFVPPPTPVAAAAPAAPAAPAPATPAAPAAPEPAAPAPAAPAPAAPPPAHNEPPPAAPPAEG